MTVVVTGGQRVLVRDGSTRTDLATDTLQRVLVRQDGRAVVVTDTERVLVGATGPQGPPGLDGVDGVDGNTNTFYQTEPPTAAQINGQATYGWWDTDAGGVPGGLTLWIEDGT